MCYSKTPNPTNAPTKTPTFGIVGGFPTLKPTQSPIPSAAPTLHPSIITTSAYRERGKGRCADINGNYGSISLQFISVEACQQLCDELHEQSGTCLSLTYNHNVDQCGLQGAVYDIDVISGWSCWTREPYSLAAANGKCHGPNNNNYNDLGNCVSFLGYSQDRCVEECDKTNGCRSYSHSTSGDCYLTGDIIGTGTESYINCYTMTSGFRLF